MATSLEHSEQDLAAALRAGGGRVTPQRLHVFRTLRRLDKHASAEEVTRAVSADLPGVSVPTVYAALETLADLGFARRVTVAKGATLYDPHVDDHHHIVCTRCGKVEDFETPVETDRALRVARAKGFAPARVELLVTGLCSDCAARGRYRLAERFEAVWMPRRVADAAAARAPTIGETDVTAGPGQERHEGRHARG